MSDAAPATDDAAAEVPAAEPAEGAPRRRDKAPRSRRKRSRASSPSSAPGAELKGAARKAADKRLEQKLAEALVFPSVPALMFVPDPESKLYLAEHFTRSGPATAAALVEAAESSPELHAILERIATGGSMFTVVIAVAAYAAPPVMWMMGMRAQAQAMTVATTMTPADQEAMMGAAYAHAQAQAADAAGAAVNGDQGAPHGPAPAGTDSPEL